MDRLAIVNELKAERERIIDAINALESSTHGAGASRPPKKKHASGITAAGRKKLSRMMKARWAARRRAAKK